MPTATRQQDLIPIDNYNLGGLAYSKWSGPKNSLYKFIGFDPHSIPGVLLVEQKLTKDSGEIVDEFCKAKLNCSNGSQYWGSSESGKIWERTSAGAWRLVHTVTPVAGEAKILELVEYQGYVYIFTEQYVHRITVAKADDNNWAADCVEDWANFSIGDKDFHPFIEINLVLYIGDGNYIAQIDGNIFTGDALDINTPLRVKSLGRIYNDLLIGTYVNDTITDTKIYRWNTFSTSFSTPDPIPEVGINAFLPADNMVLVQAGKVGNIYRYNGEELDLWAKIPGEYSPNVYGEVYPQSVAQKEGQILFGFSNGSGNPAPQLIYRIGRHNRDFSYIMDQPYPISERSGDDFVLSNLEIGGVLVVGSLIYVAWKHGDNVGIDRLDADNKLNGAYFESRVMAVNREELANFDKAIVAYAELPANTDIDMYLDRNYAGYGQSALGKFKNAINNVVESKNETRDFSTLQLKVKATTNNNNAPKIESSAIFLK